MKRATSIYMTDLLEKCATKVSTHHNGRKKGAISYTVEKHIAMLGIMKEVPDSFNSSENTNERKEVYGKHYHVPNGAIPRVSSMWHGPFVDMFSAFK
jgi:hypothetical protein